MRSSRSPDSGLFGAPVQLESGSGPTGRSRRDPRPPGAARPERGPSGDQPGGAPGSGREAAGRAGSGGGARSRGGDRAVRSARAPGGDSWQQESRLPAALVSLRRWPGTGREDEAAAGGAAPPNLAWAPSCGKEGEAGVHGEGRRGDFGGSLAEGSAGRRGRWSAPCLTVPVCSSLPGARLVPSIYQGYAEDRGRQPLKTF